MGQGLGLFGGGGGKHSDILTGLAFGAFPGIAAHAVMGMNFPTPPPPPLAALPLTLASAAGASAAIAQQQRARKAAGAGFADTIKNIGGPAGLTMKASNSNTAQRSLLG